METTTTAIAEYSAVESGLADLRTRYGNVAWDLRTVKGNAEARAARKELVTLRTSLESKRKEVKESVLERAKLIDGEAKRITAELLKIETPIDAAIKADETRREDERKAKELAEQQRVARIMATIKQMTEIAINSVGKSSEVIGMEIDALEFTPIHVEDYAEYREAAQAAKEATLAQLRKVRDAALASEQEAARLQAEREELARQQAEAKRQAELQAAELAETQRIEREKLAAERAEMERQQAAERDRIAAEQAEAARVLAEQQRIEAAALEAERAEQARKDAEARAAQAERDRIEREARAAQQAKEDAERAERQRVIDEENARVAAANAVEAARIADEQAALSRRMQAEEEQRAAQERANEAAVRELFWHAESKVVHEETPRIVSDLPIVAKPMVDHPDDCPTLDEILESIAGEFNVSMNTARAWLIELVPQLTRTVSPNHPVMESLEP